MGIALSETFTKYHGKREKVARVTVPGVNDITLTLSDTLRCAKMRDSARRTVENISRGELGGEELDAAAEQLHLYCRQLVGIQEDPTTRRG